MTTHEEMCVIVPTKGRVQSAVRLAQAFIDTGATAHLLFVVNDDDPELPAYEAHLKCFSAVSIGLSVTAKRQIGPIVNHEAVAQAQKWGYLGFMGDDHVPRTAHWDRSMRMHMAAHNPSIVYGNDLMQGPLLPTAVFMNSSIVQALGYMVPPELYHLRLDDAWKSWGEGAGVLRYFHEIVIEHMHPQAGKAEWDESYVESNGDSMWGHDNEGWDLYRNTLLARDVALIKEIR